MKHYIPYMGSKGKIAEKIIDVLPKAHFLIDAFAGGCSITQCASSAEKWNSIICNDLNESAICLFQLCLRGKFDAPQPWVSREEFFKRVDKDLYISSVWSFGNRGREGGYLYSHDLEPLKEALHRYLYENDDTLYKKYKDFFKKNPKFRLQHIERINNLKNITVGNTPIIYASCNYKDLLIPDDSVIYCDPPYKNTKRYNKQNFDWDEFYVWAKKQKVPVYVSEYECEGKEVAQFSKLSSVGQEKRKTVEKLFLIN